MENKQDIGKAFKDKLGGLHREPGDAVWQNISASLQQQKRGGFRMPFWGKATSIVLGVVLVAVFTHPYWEQYMPEIIIKMPGNKEQQTVTGNDTNSSAAPSGTGNSLNNSNTQSTGATPSSQGSIDAGTNATVNSTTHTNGSVTPGTDKNKGTDAIQPAAATGNNAVVYTNTTATNSKTTATGSGHTSTAADAKKSGLNASSSKSSTVAVEAPAPSVGNKSTGAKASQKNSVNNTATQTVKTAKTTTADNAVATLPSKGNKGNTTAATGKVSGKETTATVATTNNNTVVAAGTPLAGAIQGTNQQNVSQGSNATSGAVGTTAAPAPAKPASNRIDPKVYDNVLYSAGNFPTVTKGFVDSLVRAQNILDEKKSRERSFAKPVYALQDSLGNGGGNRNDFYIFGFIAPTNYKFGKTTSLIDPSLNNHRSSAETSNNFGAYLGYEFTSQFSVRVGVASVKMTNRTGNVTLGADYSGIDYASGMSNTVANIALGNSPVTLRQETSFIEVPVEATYAMFGTRADLYFKGGVSMFFMGDNELYATNGQGTVLLGSLNRAQDFSLAGNAGFGFYYKFLRELQLNVEPGLKYYFNTFEDANPFSLYVQAGLLYRF